MIVGVTGHQRIAKEEGWTAITARLDALIGHLEPPLLGISSLAIGTDQIFADLILQRGGDLVALLPFPEYTRTFSEPEGRRRYRALLRAAKEVITLARVGSDAECYLNAGIQIVDRVDLLIVVWDGRPARGPGGTADIVALANKRGRAVSLVDASPWR